MSGQLDCLRIGPGSCPASATIRNYNVTFEGTSNHGLTWHYRAQKQPGTKGNLCHLTIQVCKDLIAIPEQISWVISELVDNKCLERVFGTGKSDFFKIQLGDPKTCCLPPGTPVIKFDNLHEIDRPPSRNLGRNIKNFCFEFTLPRCYAVQCTLVGGRATQRDSCACIQGPSPSCEPCPPPPKRGILF